jgi:hypothetical protein
MSRRQMPNAPSSVLLPVRTTGPTVRPTSTTHISLWKTAGLYSSRSSHPSFALHHRIATRLSGPQLSPQLTQQVLSQVPHALAMSRTRLAAQAQAIWRGSAPRAGAGAGAGASARSIGARRWVSTGPITGAGPSSSGATSNGVRYAALAALGAVVSARKATLLLHPLIPSLPGSSPISHHGVSKTKHSYPRRSTALGYTPLLCGHGGCDGCDSCVGLVVGFGSPRPLTHIIGNLLHHPPPSHPARG